MTTLREAAQRALEALEALQGGCTDSDDGTIEAITVWCPEVITALRTALAESEQEPSRKPAAWIAYGLLEAEDFLIWPWEKRGAGYYTPLYAHPAPQPVEFVCSTGLCRYRKPLSDREIERVCLDNAATGFVGIVRAIERAHGIGGEA